MDVVALQHVWIRCQLLRWHAVCVYKTVIIIIINNNGCSGSRLCTRCTKRNSLWSVASSQTTATTATRSVSRMCCQRLCRSSQHPSVHDQRPPHDGVSSSCSRLRSILFGCRRTSILNPGHTILHNADIFFLVPGYAILFAFFCHICSLLLQDTRSFFFLFSLFRIHDREQCRSFRRAIRSSS